MKWRKAGLRSVSPRGQRQDEIVIYNEALCIKMAAAQPLKQIWKKSFSLSCGIQESLFYLMSGSYRFSTVSMKTVWTPHTANQANPRCDSTGMFHTRHQCAVMLPRLANVIFSMIFILKIIISILTLLNRRTKWLILPLNLVASFGNPHEYPSTASQWSSKTSAH